jgi:hypothetical protein
MWVIRSKSSRYVRRKTLSFKLAHTHLSSLQKKHGHLLYKALYLTFISLQSTSTWFVFPLSSWKHNQYRMIPSTRYCRPTAYSIDSKMRLSSYTLIIAQFVRFDFAAVTMKNKVSFQLDPLFDHDDGGDTETSNSLRTTRRYYPQDRTFQRHYIMFIHEPHKINYAKLQHTSILVHSARKIMKYQAYIQGL